MALAMVIGVGCFVVGILAEMQMRNGGSLSIGNFLRSIL